MTEEAMIDTQEGILSYLNSGLRIRGQNVRRMYDGGMAMSVVVKGTIKGTTQELEFALDPTGHQFIAQAVAAYEELSRQGQGWQTMQTSATAALVVRPTTVTGLELWNGNGAGSGLCLVVDRLFSHNLVSSTTGLGGGAGIWAMVTAVKATPSTASLAVVGNSGKAYGGAVVNAVGTTVVANGWFPWGMTRMRESAGSVVPAGILEAQVQGRIIVPPQCSLCITVVSGYAADTFCSGASWYEKTFDATKNPLL